MLDLRARADLSALLPAYAAAIAVVFATALVCDALVEALGDQKGLRALFYLAPIIVARFYGRYPGVVAAILSAVTLDLLFGKALADLGPDLSGLLVRMFTMVTAVLVMTSPASPAPVPRRDFWPVHPSGDYARDIADGARRGAQLARDVRLEGEHFMLGWVVADMVRKGRFGGLEVGFCEAFSKACARHPLLDHDLAQDFDREARVVEADGPV